MFSVYVIVTMATVAANVYAAITDVLRPRWVLENMAEVGVPRPWLPLLALLKGAGAAGLLLRLIGLAVASLTRGIQHQRGAANAPSAMDKPDPIPVLR